MTYPQIIIIYNHTISSIAQHLAHLNIFGDRFDGFWGEYERLSNRIILFQILEWLPVAVIGGTIIATFFLRVLRKKSRNLPIKKHKSRKSRWLVCK